MACHPDRSRPSRSDDLRSGGTCCFRPPHKTPGGPTHSRFLRMCGVDENARICRDSHCNVYLIPTHLHRTQMIGPPVMHAHGMISKTNKIEGDARRRRAAKKGMTLRFQVLVSRSMTGCSARILICRDTVRE